MGLLFMMDTRLLRSYINKEHEVGKGVNNRIMLWPHSSFLSFVRHNVRPNKNTHYGRIKARTLLYNAGEQSTK